MAFIAGTIIGGLISSIIIYFFLKEKYEKRITESYNMGFEVASEKERRAILEYIELLAKDPNACIYRDRSSEGSEV